MPKTDPEEHREASEASGKGESMGEPASENSRSLTSEERSELIEDSKRFKESHEKTFRLLSREGDSRKEISGEDR